MKIGLVDELQPLFPDQLDKAGASEAIELHTARGVPVGFYVVLGDRHAQVTVTEDNGVLPVQLSRMIDVPVEANTGLVERTERLDGKVNPHVIRRAPFRVYEAMEPVPAGADVSGVAYVSIPIDASALPGTRQLSVKVQEQGRVTDLTVKLIVHAAVVPASGKDTLGYTNWFTIAGIARWQNIEKPWSEEHWLMIETYARLMAHGRQNMFWVPLPDMFDKDAAGKPVLNRERLRRYVKTFTDAGLWWIEGGHVAGRTNGVWSSKTLSNAVTGSFVSDDQGKAALAEMTRQLMEEIKSNGWEDRWLQHIADEPTDSLVADYKLVSEQLRKEMPGVPIIDATMCIEVVGAVDVWVPQLQEYQKRRDFFEARKAAGDRVWVYSCLVPGGPWINRLLDQERLRPLWIGWACAKYDLGGFLHWGLNHYQTDPWKQSVVAWDSGDLPAGDSHIIYPGKDGPLSSSRFEAQRIGMEDYELLKQLKTKDPKRFEVIVVSVLRAFDDYSKNVSEYRTAKQSLLESLDRSLGR